MALTQRKAEAKRDGKVGTNYGDWLSDLSTEDGADWTDVSSTEIHQLIATVIANGDAIMFTSTRQGGIGVTIMVGDERIKVYSNNTDNMETKMRKLTTEGLKSVPPRVQERIRALQK